MLKYSHVQPFPHHRASWCLANGYTPSPPCDPCWLTIVSHTTCTLRGKRMRYSRGYTWLLLPGSTTSLVRPHAVLFGDVPVGDAYDVPLFPPRRYRLYRLVTFPSGSDGYVTTFNWRVNEQTRARHQFHYMYIVQMLFDNKWNCSKKRKLIFLQSKKW